MGVDLGLQIFELGLLQVVFHAQLIGHKFILPLIIFLCLFYIIADAADHLVAGLCHSAHLIPRLHDGKIHRHISLGNLCGHTRQLDEGPGDAPGHHDDPAHRDGHDGEEDTDAEPRCVAQYHPERGVALGIARKGGDVDAVDVGLDKAVDLFCLLVGLPDARGVSSPLSLHRLVRLLQIGLGEGVNVLLRQLHRVTADLLVQAVQELLIVLAVAVVVLQGIRALRVQILVEGILDIADVG